MVAAGTDRDDRKDRDATTARARADHRAVTDEVVVVADREEADRGATTDLGATAKAAGRAATTVEAEAAARAANADRATAMTSARRSNRRSRASR